MIIGKAITCAHLAANAEITFYRSNHHVSGLLNPFKWSKHQKQRPCVAPCIAIRLHGTSLDMSGGVSFIRYYDPGQQQWETSFQHHYTHWWKCNISSRHLPSLPVCHLHPWSISRRWRENAHLRYSSTWVLSGRKNRELSVWHVFSILPLVCPFPSPIADVGAGGEIAWGEALIVRLDSWQKMHTNIFVASQPVCTAMTHKNPLYSYNPTKLGFLLLVCAQNPWEKTHHVIHSHPHTELLRCGVTGSISCAIKEIKLGFCYPGKGKPIKAQ